MQKQNSVSWTIRNMVWALLGKMMPSKLYLSIRYRLIYHRRLNWSSPQFFSEKLQWLKIYGKGREYSELVDKLRVKQYVSNLVGHEFIIPTLAVWNNPSEIDVANLPEEFVLKCNHDSGSIVICKDKSHFDIESAKRHLREVFKKNYYYTGRETPYRYVEPKVFAESLIHSTSGSDLRDYKFFCFNGKPKVFKVDFNRFVDHHANYYDIEQNILPFGEVWPPRNPEYKIDMPENFDDMVTIATRLSQDLPFARVDLYNNDGKIYFGEITLFPTSGFGPFTDEEWDRTLGSWIQLPQKNSHD